MMLHFETKMLKKKMMVNLFVGGTDRRTDRGGHTSPANAVQCSAVLHYSTGQSCSRLQQNTHPQTNLPISPPPPKQIFLEMQKMGLLLELVL